MEPDKLQKDATKYGYLVASLSVFALFTLFMFFCVLRGETIIKETCTKSSTVNVGICVLCGY